MPTNDVLRAVGFTDEALNHPRSDLAFRMLCAFNGIAPEKAPGGWGYFPNAATQAAWERVAEAARAYCGSSANVEPLFKPVGDHQYIGGQTSCARCGCYLLDAVDGVECR